jgi:soluble lytic murein transglycosylase-like protein
LYYHGCSFHKEVDVHTVDPPIQVEHPPHERGVRKVVSLLCRFIGKTLLFLLIFSLSFYFAGPLYESPHSEPQRRQTAIEEITTVLERQGAVLKNMKLEDLATVIYEEATRYNHDPKFILALIAIESSFKNSSVSERGAMGLMQLMPFVAEGMAQELGIEWTGEHNLFDPIINVKLGVYYLSRLIDDFKNPGLAVTAYNYGPSFTRSLVERRQRVPLNYYRRVLAFYQAI